jgi:hypothetical protein
MNSDSFLVMPKERVRVACYNTWDTTHDLLRVHLARIGSLATTGGIEPDVPDILHAKGNSGG